MSGDTTTDSIIWNPGESTGHKPGGQSVSTPTGGTLLATTLMTDTIAFDTTNFVNPADNGVELFDVPIGSLIRVSIHALTNYDAAGGIYAALCTDAADAGPILIGIWKESGQAAGTGALGSELRPDDEASLFALSRNAPKRAIVTADRHKIFIAFYSDGDAPVRGSNTVAVTISSPAS